MESTCTLEVAKFFTIPKMNLQLSSTFTEIIEYRSFIGNMTYVELAGELNGVTKKWHNSFLRLCSKYDTISPLDFTKGSDTIRKQTWSAMIKFRD
eukprot:2935611-Ditylum_brightwellii.AAC.1